MTKVENWTKVKNGTKVENRTKIEFRTKVELGTQGAFSFYIDKGEEGRGFQNVYAST